MNVLRDERLYESLDLIMENTQYLSKTIDDFRNFFKVDKDIEDFNINESIKKVLKLVKSSIQNHNIKVKTIFQDDLIIKGLPNEFLQVIINIINKAKYRDWETDRKSTRLNSSHITRSRMPSSA